MKLFGTNGRALKVQIDAAPAGGAPSCAKKAEGVTFGRRSDYFVPVAFVAKDWKVTPRRIRALLREGRLDGRIQTNGYWEVAFPYLYTFGTRGPSLKRTQKQERSAE